MGDLLLLCVHTCSNLSTLLISIVTQVDVWMLCLWVVGSIFENKHYEIIIIFQLWLSCSKTDDLPWYKGKTMKLRKKLMETPKVFHNLTIFFKFHAVSNIYQGRQWGSSLKCSSFSLFSRHCVLCGEIQRHASSCWALKWKQFIRLSGNRIYILVHSQMLYRCATTDSWY